MATQKIDQFILASIDHNWQKVAMIVARALTEPDLDFPNTEDDAEFVACRIEVLISTGRLESKGNTTNWRHSEVRLSEHANGTA